MPIWAIEKQYYKMTELVGFKTMVILDPNSMTFDAVGVFGLVFWLFLKSSSSYCVYSTLNSWIREFLVSFLWCQEQVNRIKHFYFVHVFELNDFYFIKNIDESIFYCREIFSILRNFCFRCENFSGWSVSYICKVRSWSIFLDMFL